MAPEVALFCWWAECCRVPPEAGGVRSEAAPLLLDMWLFSASTRWWWWLAAVAVVVAEEDDDEGGTGRPLLSYCTRWLRRGAADAPGSAETAGSAGIAEIADVGVARPGAEAWALLE